MKNYRESSLNKSDVNRNHVGWQHHLASSILSITGGVGIISTINNFNEENYGLSSVGAIATLICLGGAYKLYKMAREESNKDIRGLILVERSKKYESCLNPGNTGLGTRVQNSEENILPLPPYEDSKLREARELIEKTFGK